MRQRYADQASLIDTGGRAVPLAGQGRGELVTVQVRPGLAAIWELVGARRPAPLPLRVQSGDDVGIVQAAAAVRGPAWTPGRPRQGRQIPSQMCVT